MEYLLSWITALLWWRGLHNSVKLWAMPCRATQDGWVIVKSSDTMWSTEGENGKPLQSSCCENPMNSVKREKEMILGDESPRLEGVQYATGEEQRAITISSRKNEAVGSQWKWCTVVNVFDGESKVWCYNKQYHLGTWNVRSMNQGKLDVVK